MAWPDPDYGHREPPDPPLPEAEARRLLREGTSRLPASLRAHLADLPWEPHGLGWRVRGAIRGITYCVDAWSPPHLFVQRRRGNESLDARWVDPPPGYQPPAGEAPRGQMELPL